MIPGNNLFETLTRIMEYIDDLRTRILPLEKIKSHSEMTGEWLIANSKRIKALEVRVSALERPAPHASGCKDKDVGDFLETASEAGSCKRGNLVTLPNGDLVFVVID